MIDPALSTAFAAFDDDALATLANAGLVRRAHRDVEDGKARLVLADAHGAELEIDGQRVTIDARGPRAASCSCTGAGVCRHRIAAVLFVQRIEAPAEAAPREGKYDAAGAPEDIVAGLDPVALERWAGKANWRAALDLVATATGVDPSPHAIAVSFAELDDPVRILRGQSFDGIVSKAAKARVKPYHAAAVLAARAHFGAPLPELREHEPAATDPLELDAAFLDRVAAVLSQVVTLGFNLAPVPLEESLFELSVSSRADSLPRLSAMLRAIAAQVRLRRQRALAFDPDRLLELAATAFALVRALANGDADRRQLLAGKTRRDFAPAAPLELIGCGGERWRTESGARGVTAWFIERESGRWLSTTLARGAGQDPDFKPAEAWRLQSIWQAEPLAVLAHACLRLEGARVSADDRLSAPASAQAEILRRNIRPEAAWPGVVHEWSAIRQSWLAQTGLGLDASETAAACLLAPSATASPYFDDLLQQLVWPVRDREGAWLALTLDHEEPIAIAIDALEAHVRERWEGLVLVRLVRAGEALEARPITLFGAGEPVDLSLWQRPWLLGRVSPAEAWRNRLTLLRGRNTRRFARAPRGRTEAALAAAWRQLLDRADAGPTVARALETGTGSSLAAQGERLDRHGLPALGALVGAADNPASLLAAAYGLLIARQQRCGVPLLI